MRFYAPSNLCLILIFVGLGGCISIPDAPPEASAAGTSGHDGPTHSGAPMAGDAALDTGGAAGHATSGGGHLSPAGQGGGGGQMAGEPVMDVPAAGVSDGGTPSLGSVAGSASMDTSPLAGSPVGGSPAGGSPVGGSSGFRIGPTPYMPGTERLSFGVFYEGGSSEQIRLRPPQRDLQVFVRNQNDPDASQTVRIEEVAEPLEGIRADRFVFRNNWFGATIYYADAPVDLTGWTTLHVALKSSDVSAEKVRISVNEVQKDASAYGFRADGTWHTLAIPLTDFSAANLPYEANQIVRPFGLHGENCVVNEAVYVDNLYYSKAAVGGGGGVPVGGGEVPVGGGGAPAGAGMQQ